jgi:hypothetical protein
MSKTIDELSLDALLAIEKARKRIKSRKFITEDEAIRKLGLRDQ